MSYATSADMILQFRESEMLMIADPGNTGTVDAALVADALQRASNEIDSYLMRFTLPLAIVPARLKELCCDMARYKLVGADATETDVVRTRYKDAIKALESIRDGKLDIGLSATGQAPVVSASVQVSAPARVFTDTSLAGY